MEEPAEGSFIIPGHKDANSYCGAAFRSILTATKASNALPSGSDFDYYSTYKGFQTVMLNKGQSILSLMTSLIQQQNIREKFQGRQLEDKFDLLEEVNEMLIENISNCIDEASGVRKSQEELILAVKPQSAINTSWNKKQSASTPQRYALLAAKNVSRPQLAFKDKIDNSNSPFVPVLKEKPNSIKPLAITIEKNDDNEEFCHPYEWEIEKFSVPEDALKEVELSVPKPLEETPLIFVKTESELENLCKELKQQKEFAIDLEHHSYRSFQGLTCLMQISTRNTDYIIDVLELRSELHVLNDVFTDPKIVKVFHGADMDIIWLQRDFGIYVVNLFDTGQAARVLHFAHLSLSYLLKHYCEIDVDKRFQLADWRIRPLPNEMIKYARQDTHYLLYVYDCLRSDLIKNGNETKNLLRSAFERSRIICLKKYEKPIFSEDKYIELYKKSKKMLNAKQLYCLKELYSWRDKIARENDESIAYVLPNHMLLQIAETLPREQQGVLACCNPIPPLVRQQLNEIHSIVLNANRSSLSELAAIELQQKLQATKVNNQIDLSNLTCCPHDLLHVDEKKIQSSLNSSTSLPFIRKESPITISSKPPTLTALFKNCSNAESSSSSSKVFDILSKLYSPFQRYKITNQRQLNPKSPSLVETKNSEGSRKRPEKEKKKKQNSEDDSCVIIDDSVICEEQNTTVDLVTPKATENEILSSTPIRKKSKKKKRKPEPDVPLTCTPIHQAPPAKKPHTPEVQIIAEDNFKPYDYSQADLSSFTGKKKSKEIFRPETEHNFKAPGKHHGRNKRHFKQGTFGNKNKGEKKM